MQKFLLYDDGYLKVGENMGTEPKVKTILSKYNMINGIGLVDKDVILNSFGAIFQSVDRIAIRRNNAELKDTYEGKIYWGF